MMIAASARTLAGERVCFVGVGLPNIVCNLAQRTVSPELQLVYEAGVFGARPERLPLSRVAPPPRPPHRSPRAPSGVRGGRVRRPPRAAPALDRRPDACVRFDGRDVDVR